ncbi:MAG: hypothetical protein K1X53_08595 [Candidatus Sumerlaeaceae bacterium]|nr:hypothetical protein [Candidatus Sumerlaeaceae bacterium]
MISGEEAVRRLKRVSQMRNLIIGLRRAALQAYREGKIPYPPQIDIRSDVEYWEKLAAEKAAGNKNPDS